MTKPDAVKAFNMLMEKLDRVFHIGLFLLIDGTYIIYLFNADRKLKEFNTYEQVTHFLEGK